jgi:hypothetical protein
VLAGEGLGAVEAGGGAAVVAGGGLGAADVVGAGAGAELAGGGALLVGAGVELVDAQLIAIAARSNIIATVISNFFTDNPPIAYSYSGLLIFDYRHHRSFSTCDDGVHCRIVE